MFVGASTSDRPGCCKSFLCRPQAQISHLARRERSPLALAGTWLWLTVVKCSTASAPQSCQGSADGVRERLLLNQGAKNRLRFWCSSRCARWRVCGSSSCSGWSNWVDIDRHLKCLGLVAACRGERIRRCRGGVYDNATRRRDAANIIIDLSHLGASDCAPAQYG